jgi:hypothetical protein
MTGSGPPSSDGGVTGAGHTVPAGARGSGSADDATGCAGTVGVCSAAGPSGRDAGVPVVAGVPAGAGERSGPAEVAADPVGEEPRHPTPETAGSGASAAAGSHSAASAPGTPPAVRSKASQALPRQLLPMRPWSVNDPTSSRAVPPGAPPGSPDVASDGRSAVGGCADGPPGTRRNSAAPTARRPSEPQPPGFRSRPAAGSPPPAGRLQRDDVPRAGRRADPGAALRAPRRRATGPVRDADRSCGSPIALYRDPPRGTDIHR